MEIKAEDYCVRYDPMLATVNFQGLLLLNGAEDYAPISQLLGALVEKSPQTMTLDLRKLKMLNSSGFQMLSRFVMKVRQIGGIQILIRGSQKVTWQTRSLQNLKRLMPAIQIELE